jgi:hypothetical protein
VHGRWTGFELAVERQGIMHACHGLATPMFIRFCQAHGDKVHLPIAHAPVMLEAPALTDDAFAFGDEQNPLGYGGQATGSDTAKLPADGTFDFAKFNAQNKQCVAEFNATHPLGDYMVMRTVSEPIRVMFEDYAWMQTLEWERLQESKVVVARSQGADEILSRDYRVVIAAERRLELRFFEQVRIAMLDARMWENLPLRNHTVKFRCKVYRMQARTACLVAELLEKPHRRMPFQTFRVLCDPSVAPMLSRVDDCLVDQFTRDLLAEFPGDQLAEMDCRMKLLILAAMLKVETLGTFCVTLLLRLRSLN